MTAKRAHRIWTDEQRRAASERMKFNNPSAVRWARERAAEATASTAVLDVPASAVGEQARQRSPEVAAVLSTMTPERLARLEAVQGRTLSTGFTSEREREEAMARHAAEMAVLPPSRVGSREVSLIVRTDGTMVSQWGPCICGAAKREWHAICVKGRADGR